MTRLFLSYKSEDRPAALRLRDTLRAWGHEVWIDCLDLRKGAFWPDEIEKALIDCHCVVGLMTPRSVKSRNVKDEWEWALDRNKPLLILRLEPTEAPLRINSLNHIDFVRDYDAGLGQLQRALTEIATTNSEPETAQPAPETSVRAPARVDNRQRLLKKVESFWIDGVLHQALSGADLRPGMEIAPHVVLRHPEYADVVITPDMTPQMIFTHLQSELLILGDPGSGKTILMLKLAQYLVGEALRDRRQPIPVILNLFSWGAERPPLDVWLIERLASEYQVPRAVSEKWIQNEQLLLLLDGLDEVTADYQDDCVRAINAFREENNIRMVVCSRLADYEKIMQDSPLELRAAILIQPLTQMQIDAYLRGPDYDALRALIREEAEAAALARTPFTLSIMAQTYRRATAYALRLPADEPDVTRRQHLFEGYLNQCLRGTVDSPTGFTVKRMRRYLCWLAQQMQAHKSSIFFLESLQSSWLTDGRLRAIYRWGGLPLSLLLGLLLGLGGGVIVGGVTGHLSNQLRYGLTVGASLGTSLGLGIGLVHGLLHWRDSRVRGAERLRFAFSADRLALGVAGTVIITVIGMVAGVPGALAVGWPGGVICVFASGLRASPNVDLRVYPNQGIRRALTNILGFTLLTGLFVGLSAWLIFGLLDGLKVGAFEGLILSLLAALTTGFAFGFTFGGGEVVLRHLALRICLVVERATPLNFRHLLDEATSHKIMRRVGGGYIFIHRDLLEHLANTKSS
jgi:hypothetical protein